ncbi:tRNA (adenosine(37)-N6)-dimethylallyltransferase MiaA, partial [Neisseria sp. P0017.S008]
LFDLFTVALIPEDSHLLHQHIEKRFLSMLEHGFLDEIHALSRDYPQLQADMPSMRCVGYSQAWD